MVFRYLPLLRPFPYPAAKLTVAKKTKIATFCIILKLFWFFREFFLQNQVLLLIKVSRVSLLVGLFVLFRSNCRFIGQIIVYSNGKVAELKALAEKFEYFFHKK